VRIILAVYISYFFMILTVALASDLGVLEYLLPSEQKNSTYIYLFWVGAAFIYLFFTRTKRVNNNSNALI
jgi:hypothetical protein